MCHEHYIIAFEHRRQIVNGDNLRMEPYTERRTYVPES